MSRFTRLPLETIMKKWKPIIGYEGKYEISTNGEVKSLKRKFQATEKILKPAILKSGYYAVGLSKNGEVRTHLNHRLVAEAFIDNPYGKPQVNHIDEVKTNNNIENLEWVTNKENCNHGTKNDWSFKPVIKKSKSGKILHTYAKLTNVKQDGYSPSKVCLCCKGKRNHHKGFVWEYYEKP